MREECPVIQRSILRQAALHLALKGDHFGVGGVGGEGELYDLATTELRGLECQNLQHGA